MAVFTKGVLIGEVTPYEIADFISADLGVDVRLEPTSHNGHTELLFKESSDSFRTRAMGVFDAEIARASSSPLRGEEDQTMVMLGDSGIARELIRKIVDNWGGYYNPFSLDDDWETISLDDDWETISKAEKAPTAQR